MLSLTRCRAGARAAAPAIYVIEPPRIRDDIVEALVAGDEPKADARLAELLAIEVPAFALTDLLHALVNDTAIEPSLRESWIDQTFRLAKRRVAKLGDELPIAETKMLVGAGTPLPEEMRARFAVNSIREKPEGIFIGIDDVGAALLHSIVSGSDDAADVLADHLEATGQLANADALRREVEEPVPDAEARGFIAPAGMAPVDAVSQLATHRSLWTEEDPSCIGRCARGEDRSAASGRTSGLRSPARAPRRRFVSARHACASRSRARS